MFHTFRESRFGPVAVLWADCDEKPMIHRVIIPKPRLTARQAVKSLSFHHSAYSIHNSISACPEIDDVADKIAAFLAGEAIRFPLDIARLDLCSEFQQKVLRAEHGIPRGKVSTYQRIARHIGDPRAARAAGMALARNPFPIIVPCHRAIRSDCTLGGFQGGIKMKRTLLEMEGISFDGSGCVVSGQFHY